jgi:hypothetical protein
MFPLILLALAGIGFAVATQRKDSVAPPKEWAAWPEACSAEDIRVITLPLKLADQGTTPFRGQIFVAIARARKCMGLERSKPIVAKLLSL